MSELQIRINGKPVKWRATFCREAIADFLQIQKDNPGSRVDVVKIETTVLISSYEYGVFEKHFGNSEQLEKLKEAIPDAIRSMRPSAWYAKKNSMLASNPYEEGFWDAIELAQDQIDIVEGES